MFNSSVRAPRDGVHSFGVHSMFALIAASLAFLFASDAQAAAPKITGTPKTTVVVGNTYSFQPTVTDPDTPASKLKFYVTNKPYWATFSTTTGRLTGKPSQTGRWGNIKITVGDGSVFRSLPDFAITATASSTSNRAPTISGTPSTSAKVGVAYSFTPSASDANGDKLSFRISNKPAWAAFSTSTGRLSGTPASSNVGTFTNIVIRVTDGKATVALPAFAIGVTAGSTSNTAPTISGTPSTSVGVGSAYAFTPTAKDANGDSLTFSISNKPAWASFSTSTGRLSGTPTSAQVGTYSNIVIRVSDGKATTSLSSFSITVSDVANGSATLSWTAPTRNSDGSTLTNLAGYRIVYGTSATALNKTIQVANPGLTTYVVPNLSAGTHYFAVRAYTSSGSESANSAVASKTIR